MYWDLASAISFMSDGEKVTPGAKFLEPSAAVVVALVPEEFKAHLTLSFTSSISKYKMF
jgi:hypothetical protein